MKHVALPRPTAAFNQCQIGVSRHDTRTAPQYLQCCPRPRFHSLFSAASTFTRVTNQTSKLKMDTTTFSSEMDMDTTSLTPELDPNHTEVFGWEEYLVFVLLLLVSAGIGIFHGCFSAGKQKTTAEFLLANRSMSVFPMSMSVIASFISAITLLGTPVEIYNYGTQYSIVLINFVFVMWASAHLYLPVLYNLGVTSTFEYLERRFSRTVRLIASTIFATQMTIYMAVVVLAPALALSQVTGIDTQIAVIAIFIVVVFYSAIGGIKAVMWTDAFQVFVMYGAMIMVVVKGAYDVGGVEKIWDTAKAGDKLEWLNLDPDPRTRHTVWGLLIGGYFTWLSIYAVNQAQVQRYLTVPSIWKAQLAIWINLVAFGLMVALCSFLGLIMYTKYVDCHPQYIGRINRSDQLLPLFVMDTLGKFKGLPGFFVAGIFSGALSTVSSGLNSLAAITLEDFILGGCFPNMTDERAAIVSKVLSVVYGVLSYAFVIVAQNLGGILQAAISILAMTGGPLLGTFSVGMLFPWISAGGATLGLIVSQAFMFWLGFGTHFAKQDGHISNPPLSFRSDGCPANATITIPTPKEGTEGGIYEFYRISYIWYSFIGCMIVIIVSVLYSLLTCKSLKENARKLNPEFVSPVIRRMFDVGSEFKDERARRRNGSVPNGVENGGFSVEMGNIDRRTN